MGHAHVHAAGCEPALPRGSGSPHQPLPLRHQPARRHRRTARHRAVERRRRPRRGVVPPQPRHDRRPQRRPDHRRCGIARRDPRRGQAPARHQPRPTRPRVPERNPRSPSAHGCSLRHHLRTHPDKPRATVGSGTTPAAPPSPHHHTPVGGPTHESGGRARRSRTRHRARTPIRRRPRTAAAA
jgi:hypothetical protein